MAAGDAFGAALAPLTADVLCPKDCDNQADGFAISRLLASKHRRQGRSAMKAARSRRPAKKSARAAAGPPRDFRGYGAHPPHAQWPGGARIAVNINLNVEAGGEHCLLEGDARSEDMLTDIGFPAYAGVRSPMVESVFEYGPRVGCWRLCCASSSASRSRSASSAWCARCSNIRN